MSLRLAEIYGGGFAAMELTTILNRRHRFRGFVYEHAHFSCDKKSIEVEFIPLWGFYVPAVRDAARRLPSLWRGGR